MDILLSEVPKWNPVTLQEKVFITDVYNNLKQQKFKKSSEKFWKYLFAVHSRSGRSWKSLFFFFGDSIVYWDGCSGMHL